MLTEIYFDNGANIIDRATASKQPSYIHAYLDDESNFKVVEYVDEGSITVVDYFLSGDETYKEVFDKYANFSAITFYTNRDKLGKFTKYDVLVVNRNEVIVNKRIQVSGSTLLPIYDKAIDINDGTTIFFAKYHYDFETNISYEFEYNEIDGSFARLTILDPENFVDTEEHLVLPTQIGHGKNSYNFDWEGFDYYMCALPILPTGLLHTT